MRLARSQAGRPCSGRSSISQRNSLSSASPPNVVSEQDNAGKTKRYLRKIPQEIGEESSYFLLRARQEVERSEAATAPQAVAAHRELAMLYSVKALLAHADADADDEPN